MNRPGRSIPLGLPGLKRRKRGAVATLVAVMMVVLIGFAALSFDMGAIYNTKGDLQRSVDAAALAAAAMLSDYSTGDPMALAREEAKEYARENAVFGEPLLLDNSDIEFGRAVLNPDTGKYDFEATDIFPYAVRIRGRLTQNSPNGPVPLYFASIFGEDSTELTCEAIAVLVPRDIAVVADLSSSHNDDSEFRHYKITDINLHEVWDAFPGGVDDDDGGYWPDPNAFGDYADGYSAQMAGPAWGYMKALGFGTEEINASYDPSSDSGLVYLPKYGDWTSSYYNDIELYLQARGYNANEINALMRDDAGSGYWDERVAVVLGLADWNSGQSGGRWQQDGESKIGNGNTIPGSSELIWRESFGDWSVNNSASKFWKSYINSYMDETWTQLYKANSSFKYRFGVKTFMNYLMESRNSAYYTPEFANAPAQPMQAVKDAVVALSDFIVDLESDDQMSLEIYGTIGRHEVDLTFDYDEVKNRLIEMQAGHYDGWTNIGDGINRAVEELYSDRARPAARKVMFLLTDGKANVAPDPNSSGEWDTGVYNDGPIYAREQAAVAADLGITIHCVSVGASSDTSLMDELAEVGGGTHFHTEGSIEEYTQGLQDIFLELGGMRPVELIK